MSWFEVEHATRRQRKAEQGRTSSRRQATASAGLHPNTSTALSFNLSNGVHLR